MTNLKLNFGGIFGAIVCAGAAVAILYLLSNGVPRRGYKLVGFAALGGAALGNWIWSMAAPKEPIDSE